MMKRNQECFFPGSWFLKAVPNKNAGFIILLTSIFTFFFFGEIRNLTTFTRLMDYNNGFSISSFFLSLLSFLWIGAQFPQEKFLSYGRILTLDFHFLIMCILMSYLSYPSLTLLQFLTGAAVLFPREQVLEVK